MNAKNFFCLASKKHLTLFMAYKASAMPIDKNGFTMAMKAVSSFCEGGFKC